MPIYNVAPYLEEAFDSILNQSLKDIEIIAVNDGSTDNSEEIIKKYQQKDKRIISFSQKNQGQSVARNLALQHATGEYIYMMDSDDVLTGPDVLQTCYEYAEKNHADFIFFDRDWLLEDKTDFSVSLHSTKYVEENNISTENIDANLKSQHKPSVSSHEPKPEKKEDTRIITYNLYKERKNNSRNSKN